MRKPRKNETAPRQPPKLSRDTLRTLTPEHLALAAGGVGQFLSSGCRM